MKTFGLNYELEHAKGVELSAQMITRHYVNAIKEISRIAESIKYDPNIPFEFANHPEIKAQVDKLISNLATNVKTTIDRSTKAEWVRALKKNDDLLNYIAKSSRIPVEKLQVYQNRNLDSLKSFQDRKIGGLNLSDRVWKYTNQFKGDIELGLDIGLGDGRSAAELSRDLREYLNEPAKLFRRVRDKRGILHLSKNAKKYSPGEGVYRSSYKNALRLTRTEVNMAYRTSDHERVQELDFVVGIEIRRSNNIFACPVCESLKGKYPKTFKFTGWHPQCRCFAVSILATQNEFIKHQKDLLDGKESELKSKNEVTDVPDSFKKWIADNKDRIEAAKQKGTLPYFLRDNSNLINPIGAKISDDMLIRLKKAGVKILGTDKVDEKYAEWILNGFDELVSKGYQLPEHIVITEKIFSDTNYYAMYDTELNGLLFNSSKTVSNFTKDVLELHDYGYFSSGNINHIIRHEYGHWLHANNDRKLFDKVQNLKLNLDFAKDEVSLYATGNGCEFVAEVFAGILDGKKYSTRVMNLFKELGGVL